MRKFALLAAAAGLAVSGSLARADFVFTTAKTTIASGMFAGDDQWVLSIQQVAGTAQTGNLISFNLSESSTASSPKFFIRSWDNASANKWYDTGAAGGENNNANADFGDEAIINGTDAGGTRPDQNGSYIRWGAINNVGNAAQFGRLATTPTENAQTFTDGQFVTGFSVQGGEGATSGVSAAAARPIAVAVVPAGQEVTFSGVVSSFGGTAPNPTVNAAVPEPASLGLLGIGAAGLLARRRRTA